MDTPPPPPPSSQSPPVHIKPRTQTTLVHCITVTSNSSRSPRQTPRSTVTCRKKQNQKHLFLVRKALQPAPKHRLAHASFPSDDHLHVVLSTRPVELAPARNAGGDNTTARRSVQAFGG